MKKWIVPVILLLAATALITYLRWDDFSRSSVDGGAYITTRTKIDSLQRELWDSQISADQRITVLSELEQSWKKLEQIKFPETETKEIVKEKPVVAEEKPTAKTELSSQTFLIIGGIICVILCILIILLLRKVFAKNSIDDLEADMKLHSLVLKELNVKMYSSELYDDYMSVVDATDKKPVEEQNVNYYNNEKCWNRSR